MWQILVRGSMSAIASFYEHIRKGNLPATVQVATKNGQFRGIATGGFELNHSSDSHRLAMSDDPNDRAIAAIHAARFAIKCIEESSELVPITR